MPQPCRPLILTIVILCLLIFSSAELRAQNTQTSGQQNPQPAGADGTEVTKSDQNPDGPFGPNKVTRKALITLKIEPGFTEKARKDNVQGFVRLRAVLSASGEVTDISVIKGLPDGLTEKAIAAAKKIKFTPAEKDGRPVSQYVTLEYNFHIIEDENKLKHKAVILEMPKAEYTEEARRFGIEGKVVLDVFLYNDGTISTSVVSGLPYGLTMQAIKAAHEIKFTPAENNGRTASVIRRIEFPFSLK